MKTILFCIFQILFLLASAVRAEDPVFFLPNTPQAEDSQKTVQLFRRISQRTNLLFPPKTPEGIHLIFAIAPPEKKGSLQLQKLHANAYRLTFPARFQDWGTIHAERIRLVKYLCLARLKYPPEKASSLPDSWIFSVPAQIPEEERYFLSAQGKYPGAYAWTSIGKVPSPEKIIRHPLLRTDTPSGQLYLQWSRLLLHFCLQEGLAKSGALKTYLERIIRNPKVDQWLLFQQILFPEIAERKRKFKRSARLTVTPEELFQNAMEKDLLSPWSPAALSLLEERWHSLNRTGTKEGVSVLAEKGGKNGPGKPLTPEEKADLSGRLLDLIQLTNLMPQDLSEKMMELIRAAEFVRDCGPSRESAALFRKKERTFLDALAREGALLACLRRTEEKCVLPGARNAALLRRRPEEPLPGLLRQAEMMLDKHEKRNRLP